MENSTGEGPSDQLNQAPVRPKPFEWVRAHPYRAAGIVVGLLVMLDLATLPFADLAKLEQRNPGVTAFQQTWLESQSANRKRAAIAKRWVPLSSISEHLLAAVIVAEDGTFWNHEGFDWFEFKESLVRNVREMRSARGASTITQQLVKNLYLSSSKNPVRKLNEWILTWYAERVLSKRRILELYVNVIEWGPGLYGAEAAAQRYYGKSASLLSRAEAACLAAVIPAPRRYSPVGSSRLVARRSKQILNRLIARDRVRGRVEVEEADTTQEIPVPSLPDSSGADSMVSPFPPVPEDADTTFPADTGQSRDTTGVHHGP